MDSPKDPTVLVSPADCRLLVYPSLALSHSVWLKGGKFTIRDLFTEQLADLVPQFENPAVCVARYAHTHARSLCLVLLFHFVFLCVLLLFGWGRVFHRLVIDCVFCVT